MGDVNVCGMHKSRYSLRRRVIIWLLALFMIACVASLGWTQECDENDKVCVYVLYDLSMSMKNNDSGCQAKNILDYVLHHYRKHKIGVIFFGNWAYTCHMKPTCLSENDVEELLSLADKRGDSLTHIAKAMETVYGQVERDRSVSAVVLITDGRLKMGEDIPYAGQGDSAQVEKAYKNRLFDVWRRLDKLNSNLFVLRMSDIFYDHYLPDLEDAALVKNIYPNSASYSGNQKSGKKLNLQNAFSEDAIEHFMRYADSVFYQTIYETYEPITVFPRYDRPDYRELENWSNADDIMLPSLQHYIKELTIPGTVDYANKYIWYLLIEMMDQEKRQRLVYLAEDSIFSNDSLRQMQRIYTHAIDTLSQLIAAKITGEESEAGKKIETVAEDIAIKDPVTGAIAYGDADLSILSGVLDNYIKKIRDYRDKDKFQIVAGPAYPFNADDRVRLGVYYKWYFSAIRKNPGKIVTNLGEYTGALKNLRDVVKSAEDQILKTFPGSDVTKLKKALGDIRGRLTKINTDSISQDSVQRTVWNNDIAQNEDSKNSFAYLMLAGVELYRLYCDTSFVNGVTDLFKAVDVHISYEEIEDPHQIARIVESLMAPYAGQMNGSEGAKKWKEKYLELLTFLGNWLEKGFLARDYLLNEVAEIIGPNLNGILDEMQEDQDIRNEGNGWLQPALLIGIDQEKILVPQIGMSFALPFGKKNTYWRNGVSIGCGVYFPESDIDLDEARFMVTLTFNTFISDLITGDYFRNKDSEAPKP